MGSPEPELQDTTLFLTVFFQDFPADISVLRELIKDLQASISALQGERVKYNSICKYVNNVVHQFLVLILFA